MTEEILVNISPQEIRVAQVENGLLLEIHVERYSHISFVGNIYKGKINRILPGIQAAFVEIGLERSAFLHASDMKGFTEETSIENLVKPGQEILVQVTKNPLGSKGARLTTQFTIPSRYLVLTPGIDQVVVSQKITDEATRACLLNAITSGSKGGFIFRTVATAASIVDLNADKELLTHLWMEVENRAKTAKLYEIIYQDVSILQRIIRDTVSSDVKKIRIDNQVAFNEIREFAKKYRPELLQRIEYHDSPRPIFDIHSIETEIQKALQRKVHLKSGGHLVFDQTEAMTTIDVNTGSFLGKGNLEETVFKTNLEAVNAIARQVRLRNLGGIIIIDFIDMSHPFHRQFLLESLVKALEKDPVKTEISELSSLGLLQMTRKRTQESLEHILCVTCPLCYQRGSIKSLETMSYEIVREIQRVAFDFDWSGFLVLVAQSLLNYLQNEFKLLADLEERLGKRIVLQAEPDFSQERYNVLPLPQRNNE